MFCARPKSAIGSSAVKSSQKNTSAAKIGTRRGQYQYLFGSPALTSHHDLLHYAQQQRRLVCPEQNVMRHLWEPLQAWWSHRHSGSWDWVPWCPRGVQQWGRASLAFPQAAAKAHNASEPHDVSIPSLASKMQVFRKENSGKLWQPKVCFHVHVDQRVLCMSSCEDLWSVAGRLVSVFVSSRQLRSKHKTKYLELGNHLTEWSTIRTY